MEKIGLIGIGLLGSALAARLRAADYQVIGFDVDATRRAQFSTAGGIVADSADAVFRDCKTVVLSLPDSRVVSEVIDAAGSVLQKGYTIVDTSTGEPLDAETLAQALRARDVAYIDATILGSSVQVADGQAVVMAGGDKQAVERLWPLLQCFGRQVFHVGPPGSGARMKLVVNLVLGLNRAALAEGLSLANSLELDLPTVLEVLQSGAAYSAIMDTKGPKMLAGDFAPQARLSQHLKDVRLMLAAAERAGTRLPLSEVHRQLLERAEAAGYGDADNSAILRAFE